jgi:hypothetical protein
MPANGRPRYVDVVLVLDGDYPNCFEWTTHSRYAGLNGYEIKAVPVPIEVVVMGTNVPELKDVMEVEARQGTIRADWASKGVDEATDWVSWN